MDRPRNPALHASIAALAYRKWESAGRPVGRDLEFWVAAEREVLYGNPFPPLRTRPLAQRCPTLTILALVLGTLAVIALCGAGGPRPSLMLADGGSAPAPSPRSPAPSPGEPVQLDRVEWQGCVVCYDRRTKTPRWTLETLTRETLAGRVDRSDAFHADPNVPREFRALTADYLNSGWERGHCAPSADFQSSEEINRASFTLSNIFPQDGQCNHGPWARVEDKARELARADGVRCAWVVTVPLYMPAKAPSHGYGNDPLRFCVHTIGRDHLWVPTHIGKSVLTWDGKDFALRSWIVPNKPPPASWSLDDFAVTADFLEHYSGLDLWPQLSEKIQDRLERGLARDSPD